MTEQLKPCPFCGGINVIHSGYRMYCHACGAEGPDADSADESAAIAAWNRRAQPAQTGAGSVLSNNDMHPAEEIAHLKDLLGKANALARIRAERIKELEAQAGAEPVATWTNKYGMREWEVHALRAGWAPSHNTPPARVPLTDEQMDAVIEAAHHSLRQYKYSVRGQQITQFDGIEAHVIRETEAAHGIGGGK